MNYDQLIPAFWEGLSDGMCLLDRQGGILSANPAFAQIFSSFVPGQQGQKLLKLPELKESGLRLPSLFHLNGTGPLQVDLSDRDQRLSIHKIYLEDQSVFTQDKGVFVFKMEPRPDPSVKALPRLLGDYAIAAWTFDASLLVFSFAEELRLFTSRDFPLNPSLFEFCRYIPLSGQAQFMESLRQALASAGSLDLNVPYQAFGKKGWFNFKAIYVKEGSGGGELRGWIRDITSSKVQDDHRYRLQLLPNTIRQGLVICNMLGEIEWINSSFSSILSFQIPQVLGKPLSEILFPEESQARSVVEQNIREGKNFEIEIKIRQNRKDRRLQWQMNAFPNFKQEVEWWVAVLTEMPDKQQNEAQLTRTIAHQKKLNEALAQQQIELKAALQKAESSQVTLKKFIKKTPAPTFIISDENRVLDGNEAFGEFLGLDKSDFLHKLVDEIFYPEDARFCKLKNQETLQKKESIIFEEVFHTHEGKRQLLTCKFPLSNQDGDLDRVGGFSLDITDLKMNQLDRNELSQIIHQLQLDIFIVDQRKSLILFANRSCLEKLSLKKEDILLSPIHKIFPEFPKQAAGDLLRKLSENGSEHPFFSTIMRDLNQNNLEVQLKVSAISYQNKPAWLVQATESRARPSLIQSNVANAKLKDFFEDSRISYFVRIDQLGKLLFGNSLFWARSHANPSSSRPTFFQDVLDKGEFPLLFNTLTLCAKQPGIAHKVVFISLFADQNPQNQTWEFLGLPDAEGQLIEIQAWSYDHHELKDVVHQLENHKEKLTLALEAAQMGIWSWDLESNKVEWSSQLAVFFGQENHEDEIDFQDFLKRVPEADQLRITNFLQDVFEQKEQSFNFEFRMYTRQGTTLWLESKGLIIKGSQGKPQQILGTVTNITQSVEKKKELIESQERLCLALKASQLGLYDWDLTNNVFFLDERMQEMFGVYKEKISFEDFYLTSIHPEDRDTVVQKHQELIQDPNAPPEFSLSYRVQVAEQKIKYIQTQMLVLRDDNKIPHRIIGTCLDVTDAKSNEIENQENRERMRLSLEASQAGIWDWWIPDGRIVFDEQWASMLGYKVSDIAPHVSAFMRLVHPEDGGQLSQAIQDHLQNQTEYFQVKIRMKAQDGSWRWILDNGKVIERDKNGQPLRLLGTHQDVSTLIEAQEALHKSEEKYRFITENLPLILWTLKPSGGITFCNFTGLAYHGLTLDELTNFWPEIFHPEDFPRLIREWERAGEEAILFKLKIRLRKYDGTYRWFSLQASPMKNRAGEIISWFGLSTDIHEFTRMENALRESEEQYRIISESAQDLVCLHNLQGTCLYVSPSSEKILGYRPQEFAEMPLSHLIHPEDFAPLRRVNNEVLMRFLGRFKTIYRIRKQDNSFVWFETLGRVINNEAGEVIRIQTTSRDITQHQEALQNLHSSEAQLKSIFDATVNTYMLIDEDFTVLNFNRAAASFTQSLIKKELYRGANWLDYINQTDIPLFKQNVKDAFRGKEIFETRTAKVKGQLKWFEVQILPTYSKDGKIRAVAFITLDISEKKNSNLLLEKSELEFRALLNATSQLFFLIGKNYRVLRFNQKAREAIKETYGKDIQEGDSILWYTDPSQTLELRKNVQSAFQGESVRTNRRIRFGDQALRWYDCEFFPSYNDQNEIFAATYTILDINDKKEAEIRLARSEADFKALFNATDRQFYLIDQEYRALKFNNKSQESIQYYHNVVLEEGMSILPFIEKVLENEFCMNVRRAFEGEHLRFMRDIYWKKEDLLWFSVEYAPVYDAFDQIYAVSFSILDVSEKVKKDQVMQEKEGFIKGLTSSSPNIIYVYDFIQKKLVYANEALHHILGYRPDELLEKDGQGLAELVQLDDIKSFITFVFEKKPEEQPETVKLTFRARHKDGHWVWLLSNNTILKRDGDGQVVLMMGNALDISERVEQEDRLQNLSERLVLATHAAQIGIWDLDLDKNKLIWDDRMHEIFACDQNQVIDPQKYWEKCVYPEDQSRYNEIKDKALLGKEDSFELEYGVQLDNGQVKDILAYGKILRDDLGNAYRIIGANLDISQTKKNQRDLQNSIQELENFRNALDTSALIVYTDADGMIKEVNEAFCNVSGYKASELFGKSFDMMNSGHHPPAFFEELWENIQNGKFWKGEVKNKARDGSFYWTELVIYPIQNSKEGAREYLAIGNLISKRKRVEEEREKLLKDLEEFAFATSHSLRKPVANILGLVGIFDSDNLGSSANAFVIESLKIASGEMDAVIREMNDILMRNYDKPGSA